MKHDTYTLKQLVEVLNDSKKFYEEASAKVDQPELQQLFTRMARTKGAIASDLKTQITASGKKAPEGGSAGGMLLKAYGEIRAKLSSAPDREYISQLEDFEDRIVDAFRDAAAESDDAGVRDLATKYMPEVMRDHSQMSALKQQMKQS
jgi:uncharacterized protein (TIGR02284 family)